MVSCLHANKTCHVSYGIFISSPASSAWKSKFSPSLSLSSVSCFLYSQQWRTQFPPRFSVMNSTSSSPPSETSTSSKYGGHFFSTIWSSSKTIRVPDGFDQKLYNRSDINRILVLWPLAFPWRTLLVAALAIWFRRNTSSQSMMIAL